MSRDVCDNEWDYFPSKTSWCQDQESERKKFEDMIQRVSHITEAIDARVQACIHKNHEQKPEGFNSWEEL